MNHQTGKLILISGPSGTGKSTVIARLMRLRSDVCFSVSATTRDPRPGEVDGKDYFFVTRTAFDAMVAADELLEHAEYVGNCYGTPKSYVERRCAEGMHVLLDIDAVCAAGTRTMSRRSVSAWHRRAASARWRIHMITSSSMTIPTSRPKSSTPSSRQSAAAIPIGKTILQRCLKNDALSPHE